MNIVGLTVKLTMAGLPEDAFLEMDFPGETAAIDIGYLFDMIFPAEEESQLAIQDSFDLEENPDLPEIYDYFLGVVEQFRSGLCTLHMSDTRGAPLAMEGHVEGYFSPITDKDGGKCNLLSLMLRPEYQALEYALVNGYTAGETDLLNWLQTCSAIYFLDKHEHQPPGLKDSQEGSPDTAAIQQLCLKGLVTFSEGGGRLEITSQGRQYIGNLLRETESYIDKYDIFGDVVWDDDTDCALFGTGHGEDLRPAIYCLDGLDPVRTIFLLRLYDGTLDEFADSWTELIGKDEFFNSLLEPVVNRSVLADEPLEEILDQGLSLLEAAEEAGRKGRLIARIGNSINATPS